MITNFLQTVTRKKTPVTFTDSARTAPVSTVFGMDRGTPIDRYYIENFLQKNSPLIRGRILEIGESYYSKRYAGGEIEALDVLHATSENKSATIVGDLTDVATLPANAVDCFICTQTFNFIFEVGKAAEGAHHLLKPGGVLLATMAGICQISRYDMDRWGDYWRFTTASAQQLFKESFGDQVEVKCHGNLVAAKALLDGLAVEDLPDKSILDIHDPDYQVLITVVARKA